MDDLTNAANDVVDAVTRLATAMQATADAMQAVTDALAGLRAFLDEAKGPDVGNLVTDLTEAVASMSALAVA